MTRCLLLALGLALAACGSNPVVVPTPTPPSDAVAGLNAALVACAFAGNPAAVVCP